jgi:HTH-type transcriptional regulator/antitoxin HigA
MEELIRVRTMDGMASRAVTGDIDEYLALVHAFPLAHIGDDAHLAAAIARLHQLLDKGEAALSPAEIMYLDALTDLVETYENTHIVIPPVSGVDVVRFLMEQHDLTQSDLAPLFGTQSIVSEVLSGKRRLSISHIRKLAERFHLPADVFIS